MITLPVAAIELDLYDMVQDANSGKKAITIRAGHRAYIAGEPVLLCSPRLNWCRRALITSVRHCTLGDVSPQEMLDDGFENYQEMFNGLKKFYSTIAWNSPVTVVRWEIEKYD